VHQAGDLSASGQWRLRYDDEFLAQVHGHPDDFRDHLRGRDRGQEAIIEMLPQLVIVGGRPPWLAGVPETGDYPAQLGHRVAFRLRLAASELLKRGPARQAMLRGDGRLRVVQGGKLASGQAAFRLKLQVPQARPARQRT
jgi:hypothetical protein